MLETDVYLPELTNLFLNFQRVIGESFWMKRVQAINNEIRGHPYLEEYLHEENHISYALAICSDLIKRHGIIPRRQRRNKYLYPAISFMVQALSFIENSSTTQRPAFIGRVQGAFQNPDDLRALLFEFTVATHFIKRGNKVCWPEVSVAGSTDLLIEDVGVDGLEIECKSMSNNKGRKIHAREALEFFNLVRPKIMEFLRSSSIEGGITIVVTIPEKMPKPLTERQAIAQKIMNSIMSLSSQAYPDGYEIKVSNFDLSLLNGKDLNNKNKEVRKLVDELSSTENREVMITGYTKKAVLMVLQANTADSPLKHLFKTLSKSAKKQPSKNRPAIYMVEFTAINGDELRDVANQDFDQDQKPTGLNIGVSKFLSNNEREHIVGVGFLSSGEIGQKPDGNFEGGGSAYFFPKKQSKFWHEDFSGMFSGRN